MTESKTLRSIELRRQLNRLVPGGAHTYAKGDDQYPEHLAPLLVRGSGCRVTDVDGNGYIEYGMGLRSVTLGHADSRVLDAVRAQLPDGANFTRPTELELRTAEDFLGLINTAEMVKFTKNGSDATSAAIRLARAATGRELVAICGDQPFFSTDDWFIGTTAMNAGIPKSVRDLTVSFRYNDLESLRRLLQAHPDQIACVILEAMSVACEPAAGFLEGLRALCSEHGVVLVFDEMITGFRYHNGGAQQLVGVTPDLSTFGKALGNGFAISALAGRRELMELGGFPPPDRDRVFLLSTTHGAEGHALAAARAVITAYRNDGIIETMQTQGAKLKAALTEVISAHELTEAFTLTGPGCNFVYGTRDGEGAPSQPFRTLFLQELLVRGVLAPSFVISAAHGDDDLDETVDAVDGALAVYARALDGGIEHYLNSRSVKPTFRGRA
ncbi:glutamate-1-semialdehyde 2,1-aminomutase [Jatrophihabitans sp. GAS493]|uniref:glutamate-1-semialdehyde 2,1-aminomutase n=1 Tax=Jatrophihabitans sp. GAS493 TaxID=1907575 RepID=UPI000BB95ABA|nr:glutamate-1-semialdehyde 2,1-aminomutase [Jatrophihabitans sp. GAS493]SOD75199.1 glutamate-1-semialdehyde 2,1-aminomutase [Jatrophihabitans sp. GAS493]